MGGETPPLPAAYQRREAHGARRPLARLQNDHAEIVAAEVFVERGERRDGVGLRLEAQRRPLRVGIEHEVLEHRIGIDAQAEPAAWPADLRRPRPLAVAEAAPGARQRRPAREIELGRRPQALGRQDVDAEQPDRAGVEAERRVAVGHEPRMLAEAEGHPPGAAILDLGRDHQPVGEELDALPGRIAVGLVRRDVEELQHRLVVGDPTLGPGQLPGGAVNVEPLRRIVLREAVGAAVEGELIVGDAIGVGDHREHGGAEHVGARPVGVGERPQEVGAALAEIGEAAADLRCEADRQVAAPDLAHAFPPLQKLRA